MRRAFCEARREALSAARQCAAAGLWALALGLATRTAVAQTAALPPVEWEYVGLPDTTARYRSASSLVFKPGLYASADTLFAGFFSRENLSRLVVSEIGRSGAPPAGAPWTVNIHGQPEHLLVTSAGALIATSRGGPIVLDRSTDGGRTWAENTGGVPQSTCVYERPSGRGLVACALVDTSVGERFLALGSDDDGASWTALGRFPTGADDDGTVVGSEANAVAELAHAALGGTPRLVAGVYNGIAFSDDDGQTWQRSTLWGPYRWYINGFVRTAEGSPAALGTLSAAQALGDTLFASGRDFASGHPVVLASADGVAWTVRHEFDIFADPEIALGSEGALWLITVQEASTRFPTVVWRSGDGGRTWTPAQDGYKPYPWPAALAASRDGRMYLAGSGGVWRTKDSLFPIATEALAPSVTSEALLMVRPNPSSGRITVSLSLAAPTHGHLSVFDVLGREVTVLADSSLDAGTTTLAFDGSMIPAGIYVARFTASGRAMSRTFTIVR